MPRERRLINMLLRVVALLFSRGSPVRIDGLAASLMSHNSRQSV